MMQEQTQLTTAAVMRPKRRDSSALPVKIYEEIMNRTLTAGTPRHRRVKAEARSFLARVGPRDPLEEVLAEQILWMHGTIAYLSHFAVVQTPNHRMKWMHIARDRLANACRRHVMALLEYRRPSRRRFTAVHQANIAQNQIVTVSEPPTPGKTKQSLSQGETDVRDERAITGKAKAPLPALPGGPGIAASGDPPQSAVAQEPRPQDGPGEKAFEPEPPDARPVHP